MQGDREPENSFASRGLARDLAVELLPARDTTQTRSAPARLPGIRVELLPAAGYVERLRERRRPGWIATIAIAVAALAVGVAATLAVRHADDVSRRQNGYRSGWQAGYEGGFQEGCHSWRGADANCDSTIVPAGLGAESHTATTFRG